MRTPLALLTTCFLCWFCPLAIAAKHSDAAPPLLNPFEVHAELLTRLYANKLKTGDPVLAKVLDPWQGRNCKLRHGSILTGHVVEAETSSRSGFSSITIGFDTAECNDQASTALPLTVVTILPSSTGSDTDELESRSLVEALFSPENMITSYERALDNKGDLAFQLTRATSVSEQANSQLPAGRVVGFSQMQLDAGIGPANVSRIFLKQRNLRLERTTNMILLPSPNMAGAKTTALAMSADKTSATPPNVTSPHDTLVASAAAPPGSMPASSSSTLASESASTGPEPEPVDETDICSSVCNTVGNASTLSKTATTSYRLSIADLGFSTNLNRAIDSFGHDATLTYLDESTLLFTFVPHGLHRRVQVGIRSVPVRTVRGVLINTNSHTIQHVYEWEINGQGQYLWPAGNGRVLLHMNRQLLLLGPDLKPIHSFPLDGVFQWASVSPSGDHLVIGTIKERHTEALHRLIVDHTGIEPEEDIEVRLFDRDFKLILSATRSTSDRPTILSDSGELRLHAVNGHRWQLEEERWDGSRQHLVTTISYCRPTISAQRSGYLFLSGCADFSGLRWYRMLRPDGHPVVKTRVASGEIEQAADTTASTTFAVRVVKTVKPMFPGTAFNKIDLNSEEISVYRTGDGHQIFSTSTGDMPLMVQSFAMSPAGQQMTVIDGQALSFFAVADTSAQP